MEKNVCCRNITIIARYVQRALGKDILLWQNLPFTEEYLKDEHNWIPLSVYVEIMDRAIGLLKDDDAPFKMGLSAQELESWGAFRYLQKVFGSVIFGPIEVYKQVGKYNEFFNRTKDLSVVKTGEDHCYIKVKFKNGVDPVDDFVSDAFIRGILCGVPQIWHLEPAELVEPMFEYDMRRLLTRIGGLIEEKIVERDGRLYIRGEECGRGVELLTEAGEQNLFLGRFQDFKNGGDKKSAVLITRNIEISGKLKLKKGQIYNAPYFLYKLSWRPLSFWRKIYQLTVQSFLSKRVYREGIESQLATIKNYVETLEDKVKERTEQLNESKTEAEYWRMKAENLLYSMVPKEIARSMMRGKLDAKEVFGTVVFTDLANFTEFSRQLEPQRVSDELTKHFTAMSKIISNHGGWVNKFLGDGILALFGILGEKDCVKNALFAAKEMQSAMAGQTIKMRVGVASGKFITGEFGSENLRRYDCLGHIVNLASRLQGEASSDEILVCAETRHLAGAGFEFSEARKISPKGIGEVEVYCLK